MRTSKSETHKLEFCLASDSHSHRLDTFLPRHLVIEAKESLVRLDIVLPLNNLEGQLQDIGIRQGYGLQLAPNFEPEV